MRYTFTPPQPKISAALEGHYCTGVFTPHNFGLVHVLLYPNTQLGPVFGGRVIRRTAFLASAARCATTTCPWTSPSSRTARKRCIAYKPIIAVRKKREWSPNR